MSRSSSPRSKLRLEREQPGYQRLDGGNGAEVIRGDLVLRNADIEFHFRRDHQIHHLNGVDAHFAQTGIDRDSPRGAGPAENLLDQT